MRGIVGLLVASAALAAAGSVRGDGPTQTDVNVVTAIDGSDSVSQGAMARQLGALAEALRDPTFIAAIRAGRAGRIGFALFVWHDGRIDVVPWTAIGAEADAEAVARAVEARAAVNLHEEAWRAHSTRLTDLSRALDHARDLGAAAPFAAERTVVNVIGNGSDNMGEPAAPARARLLGDGATINGVVFAPDAGLMDYFERDVAGGAGAFVLAAEPGGALADLMRRKLIGDLLIAAN